MISDLLTSVRVVCNSDLSVALLHVAHQIDAFCFSYDKWTLESASKRGFVSKLDRIHLLEPKREVKFHTTRFRAAVFTAIKKGYDTRVIEWWLNKYRPKSRNTIMSDILRIAVFSNRLDVLKWLLQDNQGQLPNYDYPFLCSEPETAYWLFENGRQLRMEFPMYKCSAADPTLEFAKWCLTQQDFQCQFPEQAVSSAIDHGQEEYLQWLFQRHPSLFQPDHLDLAISKGRLKFAKWILEKFARQFSSDPSTALAMSVFQSNNDHVLELIRWVIFELEWLTESSKETWKDGLVVSVVGSGKINLFQSLQNELGQLSHNNLNSSLVDAAAANGRLSMLEWLRDNRPHDFPAASKAMDNASSNGHLEVVKWLHEHRYKGCTTDAMDLAAVNGHLKVVKWLHENRTEGCTSKAMSLASKSGRLDVVRWLYENRNEGCYPNTMMNAAIEGHFCIVQFLYVHRIGGSAIDAMLSAKANFFLELYEWLYEKIPEEDRERMFCY